MSFEKITSILNEEFPDIIVSQNEDDFPKSITIRPGSVRKIMQFFRDDERLFFDQLSCLSGVDNGPEEDSMEIVYNLYSIPFNHQLMVKVILKRNKPLIPTVSDIWKTADWHEREAYDLLGITFTDHPDLRRILLPTDWVGHPLRKDYQLQKYYHGIKVEY